MSKTIHLNTINLSGSTPGKGCNCEKVDLTDYAKKKDLDNYAKKEDVTNEISNAISDAITNALNKEV